MPALQAGATLITSSITSKPSPVLARVEKLIPHTPPLSPAPPGELSSVVSTLCSTLGLPDAVLAIIIDETLKAGLHGPGVSMWVTTALLSIAQRDTDLANNTAVRGVMLRWCCPALPLDDHLLVYILIDDTALTVRFVCT